MNRTARGQLSWAVHVSIYPGVVSAVAMASEGEARHGAAASCEGLFSSMRDSYGLPTESRGAKVYRFSRVVSRPRGRGGGSVVLKAVLEGTDQQGIWTVLEASPYPGQDFEELVAFYERHGFRSGAERGLMYRPPGE